MGQNLFHKFVLVIMILLYPEVTPHVCMCDFGDRRLGRSLEGSFNTGLQDRSGRGKLIEYHSDSTLIYSEEI